MTMPRCDACQQPIVLTTDGAACACRTLPRALITAFYTAYQTIPDSWPVLDFLDRVAEALDAPRPRLETHDERHVHP